MITRCAIPSCAAALAPWVACRRFAGAWTGQYTGYSDMAWSGDADRWAGDWRVGESWDYSVERSES